MRFADVQLSFSTMMVAIIVSAIFRTALGAELFAQYAVVMLVVIIGVAEWPQYARTVRASVLAEKKKEYVEAARVMGFKAPPYHVPPYSTELPVTYLGYLDGTGRECHHV